ncbi:MAG: cellulose biosynthesis cyclic di-GMP-binding regulatory protein BcsB [Edaphobacter sp.]|uniref:cellulose biosynthesis cyclic di-GMP-binding regulatory protein BcsB n=1 Tax=Edaphobacter sp. TaxID=1934404 RepID=UPI00238DB4CF|nr:cellulose biosynthesis cyclic di-GMP-binding regulatory protein BcsB [Edaphobacter sp.]MDE1178437.1 cellulose biosynthesis cyclic di-GMP-binding regulatory protein BcsB [Edaphobacter sp.]
MPRQETSTALSPRLDSPFVAIFDCDHVPTRSFLQMTIGWFQRDTKLAMLQTPHHFYSPDPFERNLNTFRVIPNEGELFYGIVQDGNDFWNATFFCGSCAVLRRTALDEIGGIAVETITEDAHTSLRMQMNGWNTAYINIPQAAGLATERLSGHVKQRIRWARGMIQILRTDNPLFAKGLRPAQRLCYFNAMTHFLYALPRLIFLTAPLIYLILGQVNVPGYWAAILAYALPHLFLSNITNSRIQGQHRHSFWNEIYETVLAPFIFLPTMLALVNPKFGSFDVTAKGGVVNRRFFDSRIARPFLFMMGLNIVGMLMGIPRFFHIPLPLIRDLYDAGHGGTVVMNLIWVCFNMVILGVCSAVAWENAQRRQTVRIEMAIPVEVKMPDGGSIKGTTIDMSTGGLMATMDQGFDLKLGDPVRLALPVLEGTASFPGTIMELRGNVLRAQFDPLTLLEEEALTIVLYSRADTWLGWGENRESDRPMKSLALIFKLSLIGLAETGRNVMKMLQKSDSKGKSKTKLAVNSAPLILFLFLLMSSGLQAQRPSRTSAAVPGADVMAPAPERTAATTSPANFDTTFTFSDLGVPDTIVLRGVDAYHTISFSLPQTQVVKAATLHLQYHFSPGLIPALSHLKVSLNGTVFATLPVTVTPTPPAPGEEQGPRHENNALLEATLTLPAEMMVRENQLTFEFIGHYTMECEDPAHTTLWSHVDATSTLELSGALIPLKDDLRLLPQPFYDAAVNLHPSIPVAFLGQPSPRAMQAAGIVTSWFGVITNSRPVRFPVSIGSIPSGNAIVIAENAADLPVSLRPGVPGPSVAMRANPSDPYSKVLVLTGDNADDLLTAALGLALQRDLLSGDTTRIASLKMPAQRQPDDAPRWLSTDRDTPIGEIAQTIDLQGDGSVPMRIYMRVPPDLYYGQKQYLTFHLGYRYNGIPISNQSSMQVYMNDAYISSTPLPHSQSASARLEQTIGIPIGDMRPFSNTFMTQFIFLLAKNGKCQDTAPYNMKAAIMKDSYLEIQDIPHWTALPNLEIFANAGYPFTRRADLSDTAVVLPGTPTGDEIETYLTFMGHFGSQTGYPVTNVTVTDSDGMKADSRKDYLVIGTVDDSPALARLNPSLPVVVDGSGLHIQDTQGFFSSLQHAWWKVRSSDRVQSGELETAGGLPDALIEGVEWPANSGRSVVLVALRDHAVVPNFLSVFLNTSQSSDISQSVSVLHGRRFASYRIGNDVYYVGSLSWWTHINLLFSKYQWAMVVGLFLIAFLMATVVRASLRRRAKKRLQGNA